MASVRRFEFLEHRSLAGAATADPQIYDDATFPPAGSFGGEMFETVLMYWTATGANPATHELVFEPLYRDPKNAQWIRGALFTAKALAAIEFPSLDATQIFIRIDSVTGAGPSSAVKIRVAGGQPSRPG